MPRFSLPDTRVITLRAGSSGCDYRVLLASPTGPAPPNGFPVITVLDADTSFGTAVEGLRRACHRPSATGVAPAVIVGIGFGAEPGPGRSQRQQDFTPAEGALGVDGPAGERGAAAFLTFLLADVAPMVASEFPVDARRRALFGHSLAGFFALHVLATRPDAFDTYLAASPSIWWAPEEMLSGLGNLPDRLAGRRGSLRVMISVGEWEERVAPWQEDAADLPAMRERRQSRRMVENARRLAAALDGLASPQLTFRYEELAGEDHASVVPIALSHGLRFALAPDALLRDWLRPPTLGSIGPADP